MLRVTVDPEAREELERIIARSGLPDPVLRLVEAVCTCP